MQASINFLAALLAIFTCVTVTAQDFREPQDVTFEAKTDHSTQRYVLLLPKTFDEKTPHDILIALHGHGSDRWQFVTATRPECQATRDIGFKHDMIFVSPDYRAKTSWMGPAAEVDLLQILDELKQRYMIRHVILSGGSMGGTSALAFAAMHPDRVDGVVALNGTANMLQYPNFQEAITASYGGTKTEKPDIYRERSAELFPDRLTMPLAATTGGKDTLVPPDSTLRLVETLQKHGSPAISIHRPEGGHDTNYADTISAFEFVFEQLDKKHDATN